ncbi:MAG: TetR/AcrR family transcriptional regulator [Ruminococcaceae bacterium]|nr:TetR/AcrR family transcriptional regulator [Oscillospiraceae bacterium]
MIRVDRTELTRNEIIRVAANRFLNDGYTKTTVASMAKALNMSTGNMTFHFPTKEHMLAELVEILCKYQWKLIEEEVKEGYSSIMAICLELLTIASACEQDEVAKDFFLSTYRSELCMELIRRNDKVRAKEVFKEYCPEWPEEYFSEAETLVSGIEYAIFFTTSDSAPLDIRVAGALRTILSIYNVPKEIRDEKIRKVLSMNYQKLGLDTLKKFREYVDHTTEQALFNLLKRKQTAR